MPLIPETWLDSQVANLTTANNQFSPNIIQLANGNILVSWTSDDTGGLANNSGDDIMGQIFGPLGNRVGVEFRINDFAVANNERDVDMAALPGGGVGNGDSGGFLAVYERSNILTGVVEICFDQKSATGAVVNGNFVVSDGLASDPNYRNPSVAVSSGTSALVVYEEITGGVSEIRGKIYNPTTGTFGAQISLIALVGGDTDADVTALTNGNYVITTTVGGTDQSIGYRIINSTGGNVLGATQILGTSSNVDDDYDAAVTALSGGGFVISWTNKDVNDTDTFFRVYNAAGTETGSGSVGESLATNDNNESVITGLADGTFVIVYDNDELNHLVIDHYSALGGSLGSFSFAGSNTTPTVTSLADGRIAVAWLDSNNEIAMEILDTRDSPNNANYAPISRSIGTVGDDVFTGNADANFGFSGNDTITDGGGFNSLYGGTGNDSIAILGVDASEVVDGGAGSDTLIGSAIVNGTVYNLATGRVVEGTIIEVATGFENVIGTSANEIMVGSSIGNTLSGGGGDDSINGGLGSDKVYGGAGNDTIFVNSTGDSVFEAIGGGTIDRVFASSNFVLTAGSEVERLSAGNSAGAVAINLYGNAFSQTISGNAAVNVLSSGATGGVDVLQGFGGNDIYRVFNFGDIIVETAGNGTADRVVAAVSFALAADDNIEFMSTANPAGIAPINLRGNALAQTLQGNAGANQLNGLAGSDTMTGGAGADAFMFNSALGPANVDIITDYNVVADRILLENAVFGGLVAGVLGAAAFTANLAGLATDGSDRIIYETDTGFLWFDADGTGGIGRVRFADLASGLLMSAGEFAVV